MKSSLDRGATAHPLAPFLQPVRRAIRGLISPLPLPLREFVLFGLKMAWSCLFGAAMLGLILLTGWFWPHDAVVHRYDFLLVCAVLIQIGMLATRLETFDEMKVIFLYHLTGTVMEVFKTHMGSWTYPEPAILRLGGVPLFTGFMYASVGSFIVRAIRIFDMKFSRYPSAWKTWVLAALIYLNFFTHHFVTDIRTGIFVACLIVFMPTFVHFRIETRTHAMPFVLAGTLTAGFLWIAENIGTLTRTWIYPGQQDGWRLVSLHKMGSWGLLLIISFVIVSLIVRPAAPSGSASMSYRQWLLQLIPMLRRN